jgi:hypothetical protein
MKGLFPEFETKDDKDFKAIWKNALFVFDTNVLLNLYRYRDTTRDELLNIIERLSKKIWIPHYVALEFQRNRLTVIAQQNNRFNEAETVVKEVRAELKRKLTALDLQKRHSLIDPTQLEEKFESLVQDFLNDLKRLKEEQLDLSRRDPLKEKVEQLFKNRVGKAPDDQVQLEGLYKEAEKRFNHHIPPGYQDANKSEGGSPAFIHKGIIYQLKYGDFLVWHQLLDHAKLAGERVVIFVTDDSKDDWWCIVNSDGPKTIGPRPELIEEARTRGSIETFHMYKPEIFLRFAKDHLQAQVSDETLKEVRALSKIRARHEWDPTGRRWLPFRMSEEAVQSWLQGFFADVKRNPRGFPDFVAEKDGIKVGAEVMHYYELLPTRALRSLLLRTRREMTQADFDRFMLIWIVDHPGRTSELRSQLEEILPQIDFPSNVIMVSGSLVSTSGESSFTLLDRFDVQQMNFNSPEDSERS